MSASTNNPSTPSAAHKAEAKAIDKAPAAGAPPRTFNLDAIKAAEVALANRPKAERAKAADKPDSFKAQCIALLEATGRPVKVLAIASAWCDAHPDLGRDAKDAKAARATAEAARSRAQAAVKAGKQVEATAATAEADAATKRAETAAREQAMATITSRIYTLAKDGFIAKAERGEVKAKAKATPAKG